jgi:hypothetical protein
VKKKWCNLNNIRREASRHFRKKKREYLKNKINEEYHLLGCEAV